MFAQFQFATAEGIGVATIPIVAAQAVGGAGGNMIAVHNVVAAAATVGLIGREGDLMRKVAIPFLYYITFAGTLTYVMVWGVGFNPGTIGLVLLAAAGAWTVDRARRERFGIDERVEVAA